jgi:hypothetical protein
MRTKTRRGRPSYKNKVRRPIKLRPVPRLRGIKVYRTIVKAKTRMLRAVWYISTAPLKKKIPVPNRRQRIKRKLR